MESAVKNAATAEESYLTSNTGYTADVSALTSAEGLKFASEVNLTAAVDGGKGYCIKATHDNLDSTDAYWYHSSDGEPVTTRPSAANPSCPS